MSSLKFIFGIVPYYHKLACYRTIVVIWMYHLQKLKLVLNPFSNPWIRHNYSQGPSNNRLTIILDGYKMTQPRWIHHLKKRKWVWLGMSQVTREGGYRVRNMYNILYRDIYIYNTPCKLEYWNISTHMHTPVYKYLVEKGCWLMNYVRYQRYWKETDYSLQTLILM